MDVLTMGMDVIVIVGILIIVKQVQGNKKVC